jgi:hypothetical protein
MRRKKKPGWGAVLLGAAAIWLIVDAGIDVSREVRLWNGAQVGRAVVVEKDRPVYARRTWGRRFERAFNTWLLRGHASDTFVTYRLALPGGQAVTTEAPVGARRWNDLREGSAIEVDYLASDPDVNRPAGEGALWLASLRLAIGAFLALIVVGAMLNRDRGVLHRAPRDTVR